MPQVAFDADLGLLRIGVLVIGRTAEEHCEWRNCTGVGDVDSELSKIRGGYTGFCSSGWAATVDFSLSKKRLEDKRGRERRRTAGDTTKLHEHLGNLPEAISSRGARAQVIDLSQAVVAIKDAEITDCSIDLIIDGRVEN